MKIGSIVSLLLGLLLFGVAVGFYSKTDVAPEFSDEQLEAQAKAQMTIHESRSPGAKIDEQAVEEARRIQEEARLKQEQTEKSRATMKMVFQVLGGLLIAAGIVLYVIDKQRE